LVAVADIDGYKNDDDDDDNDDDTVGFVIVGDCVATVTAAATNPLLFIATGLLVAVADMREYEDNDDADVFFFVAMKRDVGCAALPTTNTLCVPTGFFCIVTDRGDRTMMMMPYSSS